MDSVIQRQFDELRVIRALGAAHRVSAQPSAADTDRWPFLLVYGMRGSTVLHHDGRRLDLDAGDIVLVANDAAYTLDSDDASVMLLVLVPAGAVGPYRSGFAAAAGRISSARQGSPRLVGHLLDGLAGHLADLAPAHPGQLARHIVGFVAMVCAEAAVGPATGSDRILQNAKEHIELHLGDLELGPDRVARALNVSTRTLHRLFERENATVGGWIRGRRLDHCRSDLDDPTRDDESVSAIGVRWGFWDAAHFSRLFKAAYGLSPRAYRAQRGERVVTGLVSA
jgi:AraC-like DNA-binding protein